MYLFSIANVRMASKLAQIGVLAGVAGGGLWLSYCIYRKLRSGSSLRAVSTRASIDSFAKGGSKNVFLFQVSTPLSLTAIVSLANVLGEAGLRPQGVILTVSTLDCLSLLSPEPLVFAIQAFRKKNVFVAWVNESGQTSVLYEIFYSSFKHLVEEFSSVEAAKKKISRIRLKLSIVNGK